MDTLTESELDLLWELLKGHAPGTREEFPATLRFMVSESVITMNIARNSVVVRLPLMTATIRRDGKHFAPEKGSSAPTPCKGEAL